MRAKGSMMTAMLIFGSIGLFVKRIPLSSSGIALIRGGVGCLFLWTAGVLTRQKVPWGEMKKNWVPLALSGAAVGLNWIFLFEAYRFTTVSLATLSYYCAPVFVIFLSPLILKEKLKKRKVICAVGTMAGMVLVSGGLAGAAGEHNLLGIGLGLTAAAFYALVVLANRFIHNLSGLGTTVAQLGIATAILFPYVMFTAHKGGAQITGAAAMLLLTVGIVHTGFAYLLYFKSMKDLPAQTTAALSYIDPVTAILLSALFLGESMSLLQTAGAAIVLGMTFLSESGG